MNFLATNPSDAFDRAIWTLIIPALFVAALAAFLIPIFFKRFEQFVARRFRQSRKPRPKPRKTGQTIAPPCSTDDTAPGDR
ncbi:MAG: hypothetical protein NTV46_00990 [Verrucomicrobia bacterium]|nr:hypothetical protein [Verrucomicrobiota bacterium]